VGCCGKKNSQANNYVEINGDVYFVGINVLSSFLQQLAPRYQEDYPYIFAVFNKDTGARVEGELMFKKGLAFLNGRRLF
jgi:hypothetical protein